MELCTFWGAFWKLFWKPKYWKLRYCYYIVNAFVCEYQKGSVCGKVANNILAKIFVNYSIDNIVSKRYNIDEILLLERKIKMSKILISSNKRAR